MPRNTVGIRTIAPLPYSLITVEINMLERVSFSDTQNRKTVNIFTANDKHYLLNRDKLTQPIQMELSQQQKTFFRISLLHF